jgi:hypothetical protein
VAFKKVNLLPFFMQLKLGLNVDCEPGENSEEILKDLWAFIPELIDAI